jgi:hypothetical protein
MVDEQKVQDFERRRRIAEQAIHDGRACRESRRTRESCGCVACRTLDAYRALGLPGAMRSVEDSLGR